MNQPKAVIFDLFHTLCSMEHQKTPGINTPDILGIDPESWSNALFNLTEARLKGWITDPVEMIRDVTDKIKPGIPQELLQKAATLRAERFRHALAHIPQDIIDPIQALRKSGLKTALCSNADLLEKMGWEHSPLTANCFDEVIFSCDVGMAKPEKGIYLLVAKKLGIKPEEAFFVGDGGSNELVGAREAGMIPILTTWFIKDIWPERITERSRQARFTINHIREVVNLISY